MDLDRFYNKREALLGNESGQSMTEYILLLAVVISLVSVVFGSDLFQGYFGDGGKLAEAFRGKIEYTYTHAINGKEFHRTINYDSHDSYKKGGATRFFTATDAYPGN